MIATHTGPLVMPDGTELPPTGKRIEIKGMELVQHRDGKIAVHHMYWDNMAVAGQLGREQRTWSAATKAARSTVRSSVRGPYASIRLRAGSASAISSPGSATSEPTRRNLSARRLAGDAEIRWLPAAELLAARDSRGNAESIASCAALADEPTDRGVPARAGPACAGRGLPRLSPPRVC